MFSGNYKPSASTSSLWYWKMKKKSGLHGVNMVRILAVSIPFKGQFYLNSKVTTLSQVFAIFIQLESQTSGSSLLFVHFPKKKKKIQRKSPNIFVLPWAHDEVTHFRRRKWKLRHEFLQNLTFSFNQKIIREETVIKKCNPKLKCCKTP